MPGTEATGRPARWLIGVIAAVALLGTACQGEQTALQEAEEEHEALALVGESITVTGEVGEVLSPSAVVLNAEVNDAGFEDGTLVFGLDEGTFEDVAAGDVIRVTGTVEQFTVDEDDAALARFRDEFGVDARTFERLEDGAAGGG